MLNRAPVQTVVHMAVGLGAIGSYGAEKLFSTAHDAVGQNRWKTGGIKDESPAQRGDAS